MNKMRHKVNSYAKYSWFEFIDCFSKIIIFTQPLRSDSIWHKVNFLSGV